MDLKAEFVNYAQIDAKIVRAIRQLETMGKVARDITELVMDEVKNQAPEGKSRGLIDSIDWHTLYLSGSEFETEITAGVFYAKWVLEGRGPVRPVRARVLHWFDQWTGDEVFAMYARPTEPDPFHERAWSVARPAVKRKWLEYTQSVVRILAD